MPETAHCDLPLFCERCGYMLQGLPPQRCPSCSLFGLRCPECGHQQHANSIRPALLRILGRLRGASHVLASLLIVGFCALAAFIWWVAGVEWASQVRSGTVPFNRDYPLLVLGAVVSTWSLYAIAAHARRRTTLLVVVLLLHAMPFYLGLHSYAGLFRADRSMAMPLLPSAFAVFVVPWFVLGTLSGWAMLRLFYLAFWPSRVRALLVAWVCHGRMPRINLEAITPPAHLPFGEDVSHFCDNCGKSFPAGGSTLCPECTLLHIRCDCGHAQPVSPLRPVLRESAARATATVLHLLTLLQAGILLAILFAWLVGGYECAYSYQYIPAPALSPAASRGGNYGGPFPLQWHHEEAIMAVLLAVCFGIVARTMMLRWKRGLFVGLVMGLVTASAFAFGMALRSYNRSEPLSPFSAGSVLVLLLLVAAVAFGSLLAWPGWWLFIRVMLPRRLGNRLLHWLTTGSLAELIALDEEQPQPVPEPRHLEMSRTG